MGELFRKYMRLLPREMPSEALKERVFGAIVKFEAARNRTRIALFSLGTVICASAFAEAALSAGRTFSQSGFWQYSSLLVSDIGALSSFWKELAVSLAASLPVTALIFALASGAGFLWSWFWLIKNARDRVTMQHAS